MEASYWHRAWDEDRTGFHQDRINKRLTELWPTLGIDPSATVFVPLCGKSSDMLWLRERGHPILGVELSEKAVAAFFEENALPHERTPTAQGVAYRATDDGPSLRLIAGDYFALSPAELAEVGALYDRASLVAMNDALRQRYAEQLGRLMPGGAAGMLLVIDYDTERMRGPPFAVPAATVHALLGEAFELDELQRYEGPERLGNLANRGLETLTEHVFALERRAR